MFSYEDRIRAVKLYIQLGKRAAATVRILGYPSQKYLRQWYLIFEKAGDLPRAQTRKSRYSAEQKRIAVAHYLEHGQCLAFTRRNLGYPSIDLLKQWLDELVPIQQRVKQAQAKRSTLLSTRQKKNAVIALCSRDGSAEAVAKHIGVTREVLYKWKDQFLPSEYAKTMQKTKVDEVSSNRSTQEKIDDLEQKLHVLQLEHDILKKANELIKKTSGVNPTHLSNREKTMLIDALATRYKRRELLRALELPRSSYFYHKSVLNRPNKYTDANKILVDIFKANHECYGYRRMRAEFIEVGHRLAEKVVRRLMREASLVARSSRKRRKYNSYSGEISPAVENVINRNFRASSPNEKWLTDISEFHIPAGKVYLSPIVDCFDGLIVSWRLGTRPTCDLVNNMLDSAVSKLAKNERPIVHSDRGAHYRWPGWIERTEQFGLTRSMSRKGCSPDNAACEAFFGRLKTEFFYPRDWRDASVDYLMSELNAYIDWYNTKRIKMSLGSKSPVNYRKELGILT